MLRKRCMEKKFHANANKNNTTATRSRMVADMEKSRLSQKRPTPQKKRRPPRENTFKQKSRIASTELQDRKIQAQK